MRKKKILGVMTTPKEVYFHARDVVQGRFAEGEELLAGSPVWAYLYSRYVLRGRFKVSEAVIEKDGYYWSLYQEGVVENESK